MAALVMAALVVVVAVVIAVAAAAAVVVAAAAAAVAVAVAVGEEEFDAGWGLQWLGVWWLLGVAVGCVGVVQWVVHWRGALS
jgi:hypothetical protein